MKNARYRLTSLFCLESFQEESLWVCLGAGAAAKGQQACLGANAAAKRQQVMHQVLIQFDIRHVRTLEAALRPFALGDAR
eukprot:1156017-Pelagomonas_calceolata.AAC.6